VEFLDGTLTGQHPSLALNHRFNFVALSTLALHLTPLRETHEDPHTHVYKRGGAPGKYIKRYFTILITYL